MFRKNWYPILIAALIVMALLTVHAGFATQQVVSAASNGASCIRSAIQPSSVQGAFDPERGMFVARDATGPAGVDGGLLSLLVSTSCSN